MVDLRFHRFDTVNSTNDVALEMARGGAPEGTVVVANRQLKGRGRLGRAWWDEPGASILMSIIAAEGKPLDEMHQLAFVAGVGIAQCLETACGLRNVQLKWPNDVLVGELKIAGVLIDVADHQGRPAAVIGIGLNVLQRTFPADLAGTATSVLLEGGRLLDKNELTESVARSVVCSYEALLTDGFEGILMQWRKYMWGRGRRAEVVGEGKTLQGVISGVDDTGALLLTDPTGSVHALRSAETIRVDEGRFQ